MCWTSSGCCKQQVRTGRSRLSSSPCRLRGPGTRSMPHLYPPPGTLQETHISAHGHAAPPSRRLLPPSQSAEDTVPQLFFRQLLPSVLRTVNVVPQPSFETQGPSLGFTALDTWVPRMLLSSILHSQVPWILSSSVLDNQVPRTWLSSSLLVSQREHSNVVDGNSLCPQMLLP